MAVQPLTTVLRLAAKAIAGGATRHGLTILEWDIAGDCQSPVTREIVGRVDRGHKILWKAGVPYVRRGSPGPREVKSMSVILHCKCRECETCLRRRSAHWRIRARYEIVNADRTWMATFTWSPQERYRLFLEANKRDRQNGSLVFGETLDAQTSQALAIEAGRDLTLWLKRVRKSARGPIRYLLVCEFHASGHVHYHALIHERTVNAVSHRLLTESWRCGFSKFKVIENADAAGYVAKYISKSALTRVRSSSRYGYPTQLRHSVALAAWEDGRSKNERGKEVSDEYNESSPSNVCGGR